MFKEVDSNDIVLSIKAKQLDAIYRISREFNEVTDLGVFLKSVVDLMPAAFLKPESTSAIIIYSGREFKSGNFFHSGHKISTKKISGRNETVEIVVFFRNKELLNKSNINSLGSNFINLMAGRVSSHLDKAYAINKFDQNNKLLNTLLETIPNPLFHLDKRGRIQSCNKAFEDFFNIKKEEVIDKTAFDLIPEQIANKIQKINVEILKSLKPKEFELKIPQNDAAPKDVIVYKAPFNIDNGGETGILGLIVDLTERRKAERFEKIQYAFEKTLAMEKGVQETVDSILESILELDYADSAGIYLATNDKDLILHSYTGLSDDFANHVRIYHRDTQYAKQIFKKQSLFRSYEDGFSEVMDEIRRNEGIKSIGVVPLIHKNDVIGCLNVASKKYRIISETDKNNIKLLAPRIANMILYINAQAELKAAKMQLEERVKERTAQLKSSAKEIRDINENLEKRISEAVDEKTKQASLILQKSKLESLGELTAGIAHEINQPLGIMALSLENLQLKFMNGAATEKYISEKFDFIFENVFRIRKIIDHIRIFSRDSGSTTPDKLNINEVVRNCLNLIGTQYKNHNIEIVLSLDDDINISVGNLNSFEQVVLNLLSNARHAVDEKEANLFDSAYRKIITIKTLNKNNKVLLIVEDNGTGIPRENMSRIFDPFFTTKPEGVGTGLGLSIVFGIVNDMKGDMFIESEVDKFTRIRIELPAY